VRVLRWLARSGLLEPAEVLGMLARDNSGLSLDAAVCMFPRNSAGLERLPRDCVRQLGVRFVDHCRQSLPRRRCLLMADSRR
jgi:hypothetical protein